MSATPLRPLSLVFFFGGNKLFHILFIFVCMSFQQTFAQGEGRKEFKEAESLRKDGMCKQAIAFYKTAIEKEGNNYRYFFGKAMCEYKEDDFRSAKRSLERSIEFGKKFTPAYSMLAKIYRLEKDYDNAIFYYREASVVETDVVRKLQYHLLVINLLMSEKRINEAREVVERAAKLDAEHPSIIYYEAELLLLESDWEGAQEKYLLALGSQRLQATPPAEKAKFYFGLGLTYWRLGEEEKAEEAWKKAAFGPYKALIEKEKEKNNHEYYYKIAVSYYLQGEYDESERYLEDALKMNNQFANAYVLKGKIAEKQGRMDDAVIAYQEAISMEKDDAKAAKVRIMEANIHLNNQHGERALSALEPAVARFPSNIEWQYMKARAAYLANEYGRAIQTLEALLKGSSVGQKTKAKYNFLLGMASKKSGDIEKAKEAFRGAFYGPYRNAAKIELERLEGN